MSVKNNLIKDTSFVVLDVETTGLAPHTNKVIEIGLVKVVNGKIVDTLKTFFNPESQLPSEITKLTGITDYDLTDAPYFYSFITAINNFIGNSIIVAHNSSFDISFLKAEYERVLEVFPNNMILCTLKLSRKLFPFLKSKRLSDVAKHLKIKHKDLHRALSDATLTAKVLIKTLEILEQDYLIKNIEELKVFESLPKNKKQDLIIKKGVGKDFVNLPDSPGVYIFKNSKDKALYIGKSKSLKQRVTNHLSENAAKKSKEIIKKSSLIEYKETPTELTALLAESQLIKMYLPKYNVQLKNYSANYFIKVRLTHSFPDISVTQQIDIDGNDYFGPYHNRETANNLVDIIDKAFLLRECTDRIFEKHKKCYLYDIHRCTGNCMPEIDIEIYSLELKNVYEFLSGQNQSAINRLLEKMKKLSSEQKYEEAATLRDIVNSILKQLNKSSIISVPINRARIFIEANYTGRKDYILLIDGKIYIKDFILNEKENFDNALEDFYNNVHNTDNSINLTDLDNIKIALAWLLFNRNKVNVHYLEEYKTKEELESKLGIPKSKLTKVYNNRKTK
ncbi:MAG TPA: exonuclease domain-containing protein [Melioribacteraceae bacterium]|nr:exonuclease domain-containing protein [Melioribacteraceae bacterium]